MLGIHWGVAFAMPTSVFYFGGDSFTGGGIENPRFVAKDDNACSVSLELVTTAAAVLKMVSIRRSCLSRLVGRQCCGWLMGIKSCTMNTPLERPLFEPDTVALNRS
jgi:hypothetical protein